MALVRNKDKQRLMELGKWGEFSAYRQKLVEEGTEPPVALHDALMKFLPSKDLIGRRKVCGTSGRCRKEGLTPFDAAPKAVSRKVSDVEVIRWVADNLGSSDVTAEEAPCARAWNLLAACRNSGETMGAFWKAYMGCAFKQSVGVEETVAGDFDGKVTVETIDSLLTISKQVRGSSSVECRAHDSETDGPTPSPATNGK